MKTPQEIEAEYLKTLPLFVSIPRSGCNWFQPVLELYFDRHRVMKHPNSPTWMEGEAKNPLWMHAHDNFHDLVDVKPNHPSVFLYRNPVDVVYSLCRLHKGIPKIEEWCGRYKRCYDKWTNEDNVLLLSYEDLVKDPIAGIHAVDTWWKDYHAGEGFDDERAEWAIDVVGDKRSVNSKNGDNRNFKNPDSAESWYGLQRDQFSQVWGHYITKKAT